MGKKRYNFEISIKGICSPKWIKRIDLATIEIGGLVKKGLDEIYTNTDNIDRYLNLGYTQMRSLLKGEQKDLTEKSWTDLERYMTMYYPNLLRADNMISDEKLIQFIDTIMTEDWISDKDKYFAFVKELEMNYYRYQLPLDMIVNNLILHGLDANSSFIYWHEMNTWYADKFKTLRSVAGILYLFQSISYHRFGEKDIKARDEIIANIETITDEKQLKLLIIEFILYMFGKFNKYAISNHLKTYNIETEYSNHTLKYVVDTKMPSNPNEVSSEMQFLETVFDPNNIASKDETNEINFYDRDDFYAMVFKVRVSIDILRILNTIRNDVMNGTKLSKDFNPKTWLTQLTDLYHKYEPDTTDGAFFQVEYGCKEDWHWLNKSRDQYYDDLDKINLKSTYDAIYDAEPIVVVQRFVEAVAHALCHSYNPVPNEEPFVYAYGAIWKAMKEMSYFNEFIQFYKDHHEHKEEQNESEELKFDVDEDDDESICKCHECDKICDGNCGIVEECDNFEPITRIFVFNRKNEKVLNMSLGEILCRTEMVGSIDHAKELMRTDQIQVNGSIYVTVKDTVRNMFHVDKTPLKTVVIEKFNNKYENIGTVKLFMTNDEWTEKLPALIEIDANTDDESILKAVEEALSK